MLYIYLCQLGDWVSLVTLSCLRRILIDFSSAFIHFPQMLMLFFFYVLSTPCDGIPSHYLGVLASHLR